MHRVQIFRVVVCVCIAIFVLGPASFASMRLDVFKEFNLKLKVLESTLEKQNDLSKRYDEFLKTFNEISELRRKNPRQSEDKELYMSLFTDSLAALPSKKDFKASKCTEYVKDVTAATVAYDRRQQEESATRALKIAKLICRK